MEVFLTIDETVALLGMDKSTIHRNRKAGKYVTRELTGRGGKRYEIALTSLPQEAQNRYQAQKLQAVMVQVAAKEPENKAAPLPVPIVDRSQMTDDQREKDRCRARICHFIKHCGLKVIPAVTYINKEWAAKTLLSEMQYALEHAFEKGESHVLRRETIYRWEKQFEKYGSYAPLKRQKDNSVKIWHYAAIELLGRPQQPTLKSVVAKLKELYGAEAPEYGVVRDFFKEKYSQLDLLKAKYKGMQLRSKLYFKVRTATGMLPGDEIHCDGFKTHCSAPHPITGDYVTFEVWHAHDVATAYIPPYSIGYTENFEVIAKCLENIIADENIGWLAGWQTDWTKVIDRSKKFKSNPVVSILDRAGITHLKPRTPGNAQANGKAEQHGHWLSMQMKELSTFQSPEMDTLSFRRGQLLTKNYVKARKDGNAEEQVRLKKEIQKNAPGILFESHQELFAWLEQQRQKWNNHYGDFNKHLPKVRDADSGKMRYQTPNEAIAHYRSLGWEPIVMDEVDRIDLFRPRVQCKVRRGKVSPYHKDVSFTHNEIHHWEGKDVVVAYDMMDYSQVWVYYLKGSLICEAKYDAAVSYRSDTAKDVILETRALAVVKSLDKKKDRVLAEAGISEKAAIEGEVIEVKRFRPTQAEPEEVVQLTREQAIQRMAAWRTVEEDEDFNQPKEEIGG